MAADIGWYHTDYETPVRVFGIPSYTLLYRVYSLVLGARMLIFEPCSLEPALLV